MLQNRRTEFNILILLCSVVAKRVGENIRKTIQMYTVLGDHHHIDHPTPKNLKFKFFKSIKIPFHMIKYDQIWPPKGPECHKKQQKTENLILRRLCFGCDSVKQTLRHDVLCHSYSAGGPLARPLNEGWIDASKRRAKKKKLYI